MAARVATLMYTRLNGQPLGDLRDVWQKFRFIQTVDPITGRDIYIVATIVFGLGFVAGNWWRRR